MTNHFKSKVALVTGAGSGIGESLAKQLGSSGARVMVTDVDGDAAQAVCDAIVLAGGTALSRTLDVSDAAVFAERVAECRDELGPIDYLFANAGIAIGSEVHRMTLGDWHRILDVNLRGAINGVQAVYPRMVERGGGHVVFTGSPAGVGPFPAGAAYAVSKFGVMGLAMTMRTEARAYGVNVTIALPGYIRTNIFSRATYHGFDESDVLEAQGRQEGISPDRCAREILDGVRKNRAFITIGAIPLLFWWASRIAPSLMIRLAEIPLNRLRRSAGKN